MAVNGSIDGERRRKELAELIRSSGEISIERARDLFEVSAMTIRRDLEVLEHEGAVRRVRGGAVVAPTPRSYDDRLAVRATAKRTIAKKALELVPPRGTISLDASTTVNALAEIIGERAGLVVCTNSIQTFELLGRCRGVEAHLTGGAREPETGSLVGPIANASARLLHARVFFASADAFDTATGTSEASLAEAEVKRRLAASADRTVLCLDSSKLGKRSTAMALETGDVSALITELSPDDARLDPYRERLDVI